MDQTQTELHQYLKLIALRKGISRPIRQAARTHQLAQLLDEAQSSIGATEINRAEATAARQLSWFKAQAVRCLPLGSPHYPSILAESTDQPPWLFVLGNPEVLTRPCLAIVGSRKAMTESILIARKVAACYAERGGCVISGLAKGIDTAAHQGALNAKGATVAVLGCGLDVIYPRRNQALQRAILQSGACISEYPPGTQPLKHHFPERNRIIAGISEGTLAIEASQRSGSLITARMALENGREVFSVPGPIWWHQFQGSNQLIKQGAKLVTSTEDVFEELASFKSGLLSKPEAEDPTPTTEAEAGSAEARVLAAVTAGARSVEQIATICRLPVSETGATLTLLEISGKVHREPLGYRLKMLIF